jgi:alpha-beta hydrolase superfamily lysophospholipase
VAVAVAPTLALALLAGGLTLHAAAARPDAFYTSPPTVPTTPGALLRSQPLPRGAPPGAHAWRILYTTTRDGHIPAVASALVLAADRLPAGPRPVLAWAHGATGITPGCAPTLDDDPLGEGAMPDLDQILANGWVVVAADYPGLGTSGPHPFLIGQGEARAVLDAVRAAHHLFAVTLADRTVVWGHSQGGNAALWVGILAPVYAPEVGVIGVAALAPGSNLPVLARLWSSGGSAILGAYLITTYSETYADVHLSDYVGRGAQLPVGELADRCLSDSKIYLSGLPLLLFGRSIWATDPDTGAFGARLRENMPTGPIAAPVFIAQGDADTVVTAASQATYVHDRCTSGDPVDYRTYPGRGHGDLIASDSPMLPYLLQWTRDRLDGAAAASTCPA